VESCRISGAEAVVLWCEPELGLVRPMDFISLAEESERRIEALTLKTLEMTLDQAEQWGELSNTLELSINLSACVVHRPLVVNQIADMIERHCIDPGRLCFEVTETAAISNLDNAIDFMNRMKIIGCRFSLDDFGTGLSSYSYLRNLPVDYVKIDGVFVRDLADSPGDYAVVRSINEIGHYMGKKTIAEFVENDEILAQLREIGVDYAQGYGIHRPAPLSELQL